MDLQSVITINESWHIMTIVTINQFASTKSWSLWTPRMGWLKARVWELVEGLPWWWVGLCEHGYVPMGSEMDQTDALTVAASEEDAPWPQIRSTRRYMNSVSSIWVGSPVGGFPCASDGIPSKSKGSRSKVDGQVVSWTVAATPCCREMRRWGNHLGAHHLCHWRWGRTGQELCRM